MIAGLAIMLALAWLYMFPTWLAHKRHKRNTSSIFIVNLVFGWSLLGWIVCLVWANNYE